ncbi:hypothetical protein [Rhodococcus tibetensis]|uniref:Uncharacterized protein n=1 Tax=Rhodococcus tibetensis TaxID=2965064 RepID=A0ABT1Q743_9NOCA|nr:hypothetical protein [Rhodococcus sp. FXJ9.536]MCQ4118082.1 hypothetical protein [Rhodococcus sp. FXJ9.536]
MTDITTRPFVEAGIEEGSALPRTVRTRLRRSPSTAHGELVIGLRQQPQDLVRHRSMCRLRHVLRAV